LQIITFIIVVRSMMAHEKNDIMECSVDNLTVDWTKVCFCYLLSVKFRHLQDGGGHWIAGITE